MFEITGLNTGYGDIPTAVKAVKAGAIDFLINNASVFPETRLDEVFPDDLYNTLHINAVAPLLISRHFKQQAGTGAIINILDNRIARVDNGHVSYQLSKNMLLVK